MRQPHPFTTKVIFVAMTTLTPSIQAEDDGKLLVTPPKISIPANISPPKAETKSNIEIKISLSNPGGNSSIDYGKTVASTSVSTKSKTIATHFTPTPEALNSQAATAQGISKIQPSITIQRPNEKVVDLVTIRTKQDTAAAALSNQPFVGKAMVAVQNVVSNIGINLAHPPRQESSPKVSPKVDNQNAQAKIGVTWTINQLEVEATPTSAIAIVRDTVDIVQEVGNQTSTNQVGFVITTENAKTNLYPIDSTGSRAITKWMTENIQPIKNGVTVSPGAKLTIPLKVKVPENSQQITRLSVQNIHTEASYEAPPRAVPQTGSIAGFTPDASAEANIYWNSEEKTLTFDSVSINILSDGKVLPVNNEYLNDPLLGGSLTIDPLLQFTRYQEREYFAGSSFNLYDREGNLLFQASLPTLIFEDTLEDYQGYELFGPILNIKQAKTGQSKWLDRFLREINIDSDYIPELFVDLGAVGDDPWQQSFTSQGRIVLSFATPYLRVPSPPSLLLLSAGLISLVLRKKR